MRRMNTAVIFFVLLHALLFAMTEMIWTQKHFFPVMNEMFVKDPRILENIFLNICKYFMSGQTEEQRI